MKGKMAYDKPPKQKINMDKKRRMFELDGL